MTIILCRHAVPGLDQLADVQDTAAWVLLCRDEGLESSEVRLNGLLLGIGWIPVIGSVGKGVLKALGTSGAAKSVSKLLEHLNFLGKGNGVKWLKEFSDDLPALAKQAADKMKAILGELHSLLGKLKELVPKKLTQKLDEWRSAVRRVHGQIDEMFAKAADDLKKQLDDALARFKKQELDVPSGTKTDVKRVQDAQRPPGAHRKFIPLKTTPLNPRFVGENIPNNPNNWLRGRSTVKYLSESELEGYKLSIINGKIYDANGKPFDTSVSQTWDRQNKAIFVVNEKGEMFASTYQKAGEFHHSSLGQGKPVAMAGEMEVVNGNLKSISNRSGHYKPKPEYLDQTVSHLERRSINFNSVKIDDLEP